MFAENKINALYNLKGNFVKSFLVIFREYMSLLLFLLCAASTIYLLVIDLSYLETLGVFSHAAIHMTVCMSAVAENFCLFMIYIASKLYSKNYFLFQSKTKLRLSIVIKASVIYFNLFLRKLFSFILFMLPFMIVCSVTISLLKQGTSEFIFIILSACTAIFFVNGLLSYLIFKQKYYAVSHCFYENPNETIRNIFKDSSRQMNGKCYNLLKLKMYNLPKRFISLLILPAVYFLPLCTALECDFVFQKEIPYMRKKAHTEKTVVFYFEPIKEN